MAFRMKNPVLKKGNVKGNYGGGAMPMVSPMKDDKNKTTIKEKLIAAGNTIKQTIGENRGGGLLGHVSDVYKTNKAIERAKRAKKSPYTKSYKEAYKNADKKKYKTEAEFVKAAKAYNTKKYGTTEPTKEAKKMKNTYKDVTDVKSGKKKLAGIKSYSDKKEVENEASTKAFRAKQAENTANKRASDAKGPKTKKRTKAGKISTKVANIFRGKGKKKDPNRKEV